MKKLLLFVCLSMLFFSCKDKLIPLKGNYPETPILLHSDKDFDYVWDKLIDLFAQRGLSIRIIDRSSGLIISGRDELRATIEDKNGKMMDAEASIVIPKIKSVAAGEYIPIVGGYVKDKNDKVRRVPDVYGEWNVRIKKEGTGTLINVNIVNVIYNEIENRITKEKSLKDFKSTGRFENMIAKAIQ